MEDIRKTEWPHPANTPPARTRTTLTAIFHQKLGESTGSPVVSGGSMNRERAMVMNMAKKNKEGTDQDFASLSMLNVIFQ
jgi:hypothetical protein